MDINATKSLVEEIFELIRLYGDQKYGEVVTVTSHMVQSGYLAEERGYDLEMVVAAFLHDIGHLVPNAEGADMDVFGKVDHELLGGNYLRDMGFSQRVCELVEQHVQAKRYLATDKDYYQKLSLASKETLKYQGGPLNREEMIEMEEGPFFRDILKLRRIDDDAKELGFDETDLKHFRELVSTYLLQR